MKPNDLFKTHFLNLFFKGVINFSLYFTADSFTNKAQFDAGFKKRLKLKDDIGSDCYVAPRKCNLFLLFGYYCFALSYRSFEMY